MAQVQHAPPTVFTGNARVLASGTVIAFDRGSEIRFQLGPLDERLAIAFRFEDVPGAIGDRLEVKQVASREIVLVLRNFGNLAGDGTATPIKLGNLGGLQLYVNFRVFGLPSSVLPIALQYTFYERDDVRLAAVQLRALQALDAMRPPPGKRS